MVKNQPLVKMESMKMQVCDVALDHAFIVASGDVHRLWNENLIHAFQQILRAPRDGVVASVNVNKGDFVGEAAVIIALEPLA